MDRGSSSATLVRGCQLVKGLSMSLGSDAEYAALLKQKEDLEASSSNWNIHQHPIDLLKPLGLVFWSGLLGNHHLENKMEKIKIIGLPI